jgi:mRNA-degrading endonuclease RelE of RelBE toxin-antitoxin system
VALQAESGVFQVRVGDFRIFYEVLAGLLFVQVVRIGRRREVYRRGSPALAVSPVCLRR